jgi:hypothetical protein
VPVPHRLAIWIVLASLACDTPGETAAPVQPRPSASVADGKPSTEAKSVAPAPKIVAPAPNAVAPTGWFRSETLCLELFANGDFELAMMGSGPKVLVMGAAKLTASGTDAFTAELAVQRIWKARFTGPCRRTHETGDFVDEKSALGTTFTKGATAKLKLTRKDDDHIELCGEQCTTLARDTPAIGSRWRIAGLENASKPEVRFTAGDLLQIDIDTETGYMAHVWAAKDATTWNDPNGAMTIESKGDDRFAITFTPNDHGELAAGATVLGEPLARAKPIAFTARRLPNERLEVCTTETRCATLERAFDAYDHDIR